MNSSTLKILVPVVLLIGVVFAITLFSQNTPTEPEDKRLDKTETAKKPLRFFSTIRRWNPASGGSLEDREFPGFFEPGETQYRASFWFENRNPAPVEMQLLKVSCTSCSGGQVAPIPTDVTKQILQMTAISTLPQGLASGFPLLLSVPAAQLDRNRSILTWQAYEFSKPPAEVIYTVPAAPSGDKWAEQWAILDLNFKVRPGAQGPLTAEFLTRIQGSEETAGEKFAIGYEAAAAFDLDKAVIDVGELTDDSAVQSHEVIIYSSTRKAHQMPNVVAVVAMPPGASGDPGEFVQAGAAVPIPEERLEELAIKLSIQAKKAIRVQAAFRLPVTVKVKHGQTKLDIGRMERLVSITQGTETKQVRVHGAMRGPVYLIGAKEIGFGPFASADQQTVTIEVETERTGVELAIVNDLTRPKFLKLELRKQPDNGDRGSYKLKATLPANEQRGEIKDGVVVLEAKGPNPQRLRILVRGYGR